MTYIAPEDLPTSYVCRLCYMPFVNTIGVGHLRNEHDQHLMTEHPGEEWLARLEAESTARQEAGRLMLDLLTMLCDHTLTDTVLAEYRDKAERLATP